MLFILILNEICYNDRFCMREKHSFWLKLTQTHTHTQKENENMRHVKVVARTAIMDENLKFWHKICLRNLRRMLTVAAEWERERDIICCFDKRMKYFSLIFLLAVYLFESVRMCVRARCAYLYDDSFSILVFVRTSLTLSLLVCHAYTHYVIKCDDAMDNYEYLCWKCN